MKTNALPSHAPVETLYIGSANLVSWPDNPRKHRPSAEIDAMMESIIENGQLVALHVRPVPNTTGTYEVIFGETKRLAIAQAIKLKRVPADYAIKVEIHDISDDEAQVRAIAENVQRNTMTEVDKATAVHKLSQSMKASDVTRKLGIARRQFDRYLTFARLEDRAQQLITDEIRPFDWGVALAQCDGPLRNRIIDDVLSNPQMWTQVDQIQAERRKKQILASNALFDVSKAGLGTVSDLFEGQEWVTDVEGFWKHQNAAIDALREELEKDGNDEVLIFDTEPPLHNYVPAEPNAAGRRIAVIYKKLDGEVITYRNLMIPAAEKASAVDNDDDLFVDDEDGDYQPPRTMNAGVTVDPDDILTDDAGGQSIVELAGQYPSPSSTEPTKKSSEILKRVLIKGHEALLADDDEAATYLVAAVLAGEINEKNRTVDQTIALGDLLDEAGIMQGHEGVIEATDVAALKDIALPRLARVLVPAMVSKEPFAHNAKRSIVQKALAARPDIKSEVFHVSDIYLETLSLRELRGLALELKLADLFKFDPLLMSQKELRLAILATFESISNENGDLSDAQITFLKGWAPYGL